MRLTLLASCATLALAACGSGGNEQTNDQAIPDVNRMEALPPLDDVQPPGNEAAPGAPAANQAAAPPAAAPDRARPDRPPAAVPVPIAPPPPPPPPPRRPPPVDHNGMDHGNHSG